MWNLFKILIGIFLLILILPLLWILIKMILVFLGWVLTNFVFSTSIFGIIFIILVIAFILWCVLS